MPVFRKILCPVDTSDFSARALEHAAALAGWYRADITVLYVRPIIVPPALWFGAPAVLPPEAEVPGADAALGEFVRATIGDTAVRLEVRDGAIVHEILQLAAALPADLIVMGTHGLSGFERLLLGSVTEKTLRKAAVPVLTVPRRAAEGGEEPHVTFGTIVCGVDRSAASRLALEYALSLARESGGRLVLVHALEDLSQEDPRFASHFNTAECLREIAPEVRAEYEALVPASARQADRLEVRVPPGKAYREILSAASETGADLIVLGAAGTSMPFGTTAQHVLRQASCPVLVVPSRSAAPGASPEAAAGP